VYFEVAHPFVMKIGLHNRGQRSCR